ncbi:MAG: ketopantoate reductase family protein [Pleomorphochaeta sp.]
MKIAIIGAGAMGSIYGGKLSSKNDVSLIDTNEKVVNIINSDGLKIDEENKTNIYKPKAYINSEKIGEVDLLIVFVKAIYSKAALDQNKNLIGKNTYLMTLQNGAGHQDLLMNYVSEDKIIIGTTEDVGKVIDFGHIARSGKGKTNIGFLNQVNEDFLSKLINSFNESGFDTHFHKNINQLIWNKLFINTTLSATTALLQCEIGYLGKCKNALNMVEQLLDESIAVATSLNLKANKALLMEEINAVIKNASKGVTSICADIRNSRKTEVDTISGAVVKEGEKHQIPTPTHNFVVNQIHALEAK